MNTAVKVLVIIGLAIAILTLISNLIPNVITENMTSALTYFFTTINNLNAILPTDTIFTSIKALSGYFLFVALYYTIKTIFHWFR